MLCPRLVLIALVLGVATPASAQLGGAGVPSYNPGVPSYNPGVPSQSPGIATGRQSVPRAVRRVPPPGFFPAPPVSQTIIIYPPRRGGFDDPFFD